MASPRTLRTWLTAALSAALVAAGATGTARAEPADAPVAPTAVTFSDTFDGPAGAAVDSSKWQLEDRKSTRLNSSHVKISYAVFCLKKKKKKTHNTTLTPQ